MINTFIHPQNVASKDWYLELEECYGSTYKGLLPVLFALEPGLVVSLNRAMLQGRPWKRVVRVLPLTSICEVLMNTAQRMEAACMVQSIRGRDANAIPVAIDTIEEVDEADYQVDIHDVL